MHRLGPLDRIPPRAPSARHRPGPGTSQATSTPRAATLVGPTLWPRVAAVASPHHQSGCHGWRLPSSPSNDRVPQAFQAGQSTCVVLLHHRPWISPPSSPSLIHLHGGRSAYTHAPARPARVTVPLAAPCCGRRAIPGRPASAPTTVWSGSRCRPRLPPGTRRSNGPRAPACRWCARGTAASSPSGTAISLPEQAS
jgi:hypothetical protein